MCTALLEEARPFSQRMWMHLQLAEGGTLTPLQRSQKLKKTAESFSIDFITFIQNVIPLQVCQSILCLKDEQGGKSRTCRGKGRCGSGSTSMSPRTPVTGCLGCELGLLAASKSVFPQFRIGNVSRAFSSAENGMAGPVQILRAERKRIVQ